jgi:hypothetical protein
LSIGSLQELTRNATPFCETLFRQVWQDFIKFGKKYGNDDYRSVFFGTYCETLLWTLVQLENFSNHNPDPIIKKRFAVLKRSSLAQILLQYDTINRQSFTVVTMALVEDFINAICEELFGKTFPKYSISIQRLCDRIFPASQDKFNRLYSLYLVRNTLHNNGFLKILKNDFNLQIGSRLYQFRKGQQLTFTGWQDLFIITGDLISVITELIENPNILGISKIKHTNALD